MPFTYLIGWSEHQIYYYGVRYGSSQPTSLWTTYFTSSKLVAQKRKLYGEPDIVQVRKTFENPNDAINWEFRVLRRLKVLQTEKWLNCRIAPGIHAQSGNKNPMFGKTHSDETKRKISSARTGTIWNATQKEQCSIRNSGDKNPFYGKAHTEETRKTISKSLKGKCTGEKCHSAKIFVFVDPNGIEYKVHGGFSKFCDDHELSRSKMVREMNKGAIAPFKRNNMTTQNTLNCIGWSVTVLN